MSVSPEIIEKIKKLLRLSRSSNPHEAQLALQRALELARQHDVAVEALNPDAQAREKTVTHKDTDFSQRMSLEKRYAVKIVGAFFHVSPVFNEKIVRPVDGYPYVGKFVTFVGTAADVEIAVYVFNFLAYHFAYCWRKHRGRLRNRHAFIDGMYLGLFQKLHEALPQPSEREAKGNELALQEHENYIASTIGKTEPTEPIRPDRVTVAAMNAGYLQGLQTNILTPLKDGKPAPLALT